jgi:hypothetical protein
MCRKARVQFGLVRRQTKLCRTTTQAMPHIVRAAAQTVTTCQSVFADRRWNCTSIETAPSFTPDITTGRFLSFHNDKLVYLYKNLTQLTRAETVPSFTSCITQVSFYVRECIQKFPDWPSGARAENGILLCR